MGTRRDNIIDASTKLSAKLDSETDADAAQFLPDSVLFSSQHTADSVTTERRHEPLLRSVSLC